MMSAMRTTIKEQIGILLIGLLTGIILTHFFPDLYIATVVFLENLAGQVNGELIKERIGILLIGFLIVDQFDANSRWAFLRLDFYELRLFC